jgi:hypothetical protein
MGRLLDKIKAQGAADLRICGKQAGATLPESAIVAESCGLQNQIKSNPQNPQSLRTLKPVPDIAFHKSASPQGAPNDSPSGHPENTRIKLSVLPKQRLINLAIEEGIYEHGLQLTEREIAALVPPSDWRDSEKCTTEELKAWGAALVLRAIRYRGQVPAGWDKIANCENCGPVYSFTPGDCLACPWCELKRAGKYVPVPGGKYT